MADVIYKKGLSANLDDVAIAEGQILVTEDTGEMYIDMSDDTRKKISDKEATDKIATLDAKINTLLSTKLTRQIVETLPPIEEGNETTIYMVGPKDDNTYDEYMKVPNGMVCESVTNVGNRHNIQPTLTSFEQENGYYIIPDIPCVSVTGGVGNFNGNGASVAFGFNSNEEGERFAQFCQPNEIYTLKIKVDSSTSSIPNITEIKACKTGPAYELIGNTSVDLSTKQDKFAEYDLAHNCWVPADTFQLGSNDKSYLSLINGVASINGNTKTQLGVTGGTVELSRQTLNNKTILTLAMNGTARKRCITGVTDVENADDVANKQYVDNEIVKSKYEILQTAIAGTDITQTNGPMISGIYTVTTISNGAIGVKDPNGNSWTLNVQNTNLNFSRNDQLLITTRTGAITGEIVTIKEVKKQDKLQLIKEHIKHNTVELTGSIKTIEQRKQSNCVYVGGSSGISTDTEYTVVNISPTSATSVTIYINQSGASFNFKHSGMLEMGIGDTFTLEKVDGTTGTLVMNDKFNIHINHKITQSTDVTILGVKTPTAESSNTVAANKEYVDNFIKQETELKDTVIINNAGGSIDANKEHKIIATSVSGNDIVISWSTDTGGTSGASCSFSSTTNDYIKNNIDKLDSITFMFAYDYMVPEENTGEAIIRFKSYDEIINAKMDKFAEVDKDNNGNITLRLPQRQTDPETGESHAPSLTISQNDDNAYIDLSDNSIHTFSASDTNIVSDTDLNLTTLSGGITIESAKDISLQANNIIVGKTTTPGAIHNVATPVTNSPDTDAANKKYVDDATNALDTKINQLSNGGLTRQIVETLPPVADGDESIIYIVGPKDDGTYDEYMFIKTDVKEYSQGFSSEAPFVDTLMNITPDLTTFPQQGYTTTLENMKCTARVQIGPAKWGLTFTGEGVTISNPTNDEALYNFVAIDGVYTFKIDHFNGAIIAFKVLDSGYSYELIGTNDLPNKQDKFADVSIQEGSNKYILNTDTGINWTTNIGFKITNTTDMGEISILNATDLDGVKIGSASNPYVVSTYGIYNSKGSPASRVYIDSEQSGLMSNYHGFLATDDISSSIYGNNYSNIVIDKSNENIYLNSNKIIVGTSGMLSSGVNTLGTITNVATPVNGTDAVNKEYVDSVKDHILLKDTATGETYKICVTNGQLTIQATE